MSIRPLNDIDYIIEMRFHGYVDSDGSTAQERMDRGNFCSLAIGRFLKIDTDNAWKAVLHCKTEEELREFLETEAAIANVRAAV